MEVSIKLYDKKNNIIKGRLLGFGEDIHKYTGKVGYNFTDEFAKEVASLPSSDLVPSQFVNDQRKFYGYDKIWAELLGYTLDINNKATEANYFTLYTNKIENTIFMYLSEDDVKKLNDIKVLFNYRCVDADKRMDDFPKSTKIPNKRVNKNLCSTMIE